MNKKDTSVDVYERLADALEALPSGFHRTPSRVEIELMKIVFSYEEASLAGQLTRTPETAAEIAKRIGLDEEKVTVLLESMAPRRMIRSNAVHPAVAAALKAEAQKAGKEPEPVKKYRLNPFLIGWFEGYLTKIGPQTERFAKLYMQFVKEGGGERVFGPRPGPLGVVPCRGSLNLEWLKREPHLDIDAHFQRYDRFFVFDCVCKNKMAAAHGHSCDMPLKRCGFAGMPPAVPLSENVIPRDEAIKLWEEFDAMGTMIILGAYGFVMEAEAPQFVGGCHCCGCCCAILSSARLDPNIKEHAQRSNYRAVKDDEACIQCGECIRRCQVLAHTWEETEEGEVSVYDREKCIGCGACVMGCDSNALEMEPVSEEEWFHVASSFTEWEEKRLEYLEAEKM